MTSLCTVDHCFVEPLLIRTVPTLVAAEEYLISKEQGDSHAMTGGRPEEAKWPGWAEVSTMLGGSVPALELFRDSTMKVAFK
jgi:hypothetical protein